METTDRKVHYSFLISEFYSNISISRHLGNSVQAPVIYHGAKREQLVLKMDTADIVLTTYDTMTSDYGKHGPLFTRDWARVILDEGKPFFFTVLIP